MAFNGAMDKADERVKSPPKYFVDEVYRLISTSKPLGDGTYKVRGSVCNYHPDYDDWMKKQGIRNLKVTRSEDKYEVDDVLEFTISRVHT